MYWNENETELKSKLFASKEKAKNFAISMNGYYEEFIDEELRTTYIVFY